MQPNKKKVRIVAMSDTHDKHKEIQPADLPPADIFIHAGDFTRWSRKKQFQKFRAFLESLPYKHKIVIAGNHDFALQCDQQRYKDMCQTFNVRPKEMVDPEQQLKKIKELCTYLNHQSVQVEGISIFGSPYVVMDKMMGFSYKEEQGQKIWTKMPQKVDIMVTHGPPFGIRDISVHNNEHVGCKVLLQRVKQIKPKFHIFGHIHEGHGSQQHDQTTFYNVAFMDQKYKPTNKPTVIEFEVDEKL